MKCLSQTIDGLDPGLDRAEIIKTGFVIANLTSMMVKYFEYRDISTKLEELESTVTIAEENLKKTKERSSGAVIVDMFSFASDKK